jgi:hypothetical protein
MVATPQEVYKPLNRLENSISNRKQLKVQNIKEIKT